MAFQSMYVQEYHIGYLLECGCRPRCFNCLECMYLIVEFSSNGSSREERCIGMRDMIACGRKISGVRVTVLLRGLTGHSGYLEQLTLCIKRTSELSKRVACVF